MPVEVYISERTGLRVMLAQVPGPLVTGLACVATEALDNPPRWRQDDGMAHILEHLVMAGSEDFPYNGVLDQEALVSASASSSSPSSSSTPPSSSSSIKAEKDRKDNLLLLLPPGGPTKAWHDTDYTGYTLTTAGAAGFLVLLPVLLDHVFFPLLSPSAFLTEIHHINGQGRDGGNVYEEMRAVEAAGGEGGGKGSPRQRLLEMLYPPESGYRAMTGGRSSKLRQVTREGVLDFHREFYRPDNVALVVTGRVEVKELFASLEGIEAKLLKAARTAGAAGTGPGRFLGSFLGAGSTPIDVRRRPWFHCVEAATMVPPSSSSSSSSTGGGPRIDRITYPSTASFSFHSKDRQQQDHHPLQQQQDEEEECQALLGWLGPSWEDFQANLAWRILLLYLVEGTSAPLQRMVLEMGVCRTLTFGMQEGRRGMCYLTFEGVRSQDLERIYPAFKDLLEEEGGGQEGEGGLDMGRIRALIHRERMRYLSDIEEDPYASLTSLLLYAFLYGKREGEKTQGEGGKEGTVSEAEEAAQLKDRVQNTVSRLEALPCREESVEDKRYWKQLLQGTLLDASKTVLVLARPNSNLTRAREEAEEERQKEQAQWLGVEELAKRGLALVAAKEEMSRPCPPQLLDALLASAPVAAGGVGGGKDGGLLPSVPVCTVRNVLTPSGKAVFEVLSTITHDNSCSSGGSSNDKDEYEDQEAREGGKDEDDLTLPTPAFTVKDTNNERGVLSTALKVAQALHANGLGAESPFDPQGRPYHLPFFCQWDHVEATEFVTVTVWLETSSVPDHLRPLLELWLEVLFDLPIRQEDGSLWSPREVARYLQADTVSASNALGTGRSNFYAGIWSQAASVTLKVEADKHWHAVRWLRNLLYRTEMCPEQVKNAATKLLGEIEGYQQDGMSVCSGLMRGLTFDACRSNHAATSFIRQYGVLTAVLQRLRTHPLGILTELTALQEALTQPWNLRVHVVCDVLAQPDPVRPWLRDFLPLTQARLATKVLQVAAAAAMGGESKGGQEQRQQREGALGTSVDSSFSSSSTSGTAPAGSTEGQSGDEDDIGPSLLPLALSSLRCPVVESRTLRTIECLNPSGKGLLISSPAIDAGYLIQCAPFDPHADDLFYGSPGYAALLVTMEYLIRHAPLQQQQRHSSPYSSHTSRGHTTLAGSTAAAAASAAASLPAAVPAAGSYELTCSPEQGILTLSFYKSPNLTVAYTEAQDLVRAYAGGALEIDTHALAAAKGAVMFEYLDRVWTGPAAAQQSFMNYFRGTSPRFCVETIAAVQEVREVEVVRAVRKHVLRLFDVTRTSMVAACPSSQALSLKFDLVRKLGRPVVESGTIERVLARVVAEEDSMSETESSTSCSDTSLAMELLERGGGGEGGMEGMKDWVGEVVMRRPDRLLIAAAAMAGVAFALAQKR